MGLQGKFPPQFTFWSNEEQKLGVDVSQLHEFLGNLWTSLDLLRTIQATPNEHCT